MLENWEPQQPTLILCASSMRTRAFLAPVTPHLQRLAHNGLFKNQFNKLMFPDKGVKLHIRTRLQTEGIPRQSEPRRGPPSFTHKLLHLQDAVTVYRVA